VIPIYCLAGPWLKQQLYRSVVPGDFETNRLALFAWTQFRTENRWALFLELLYCTS